MAKSRSGYGRMALEIKDSMQIDPQLMSLMIAAQSFMMGGLLLSVALGKEGKAALSVRMRGAAMFVQGIGYALISQRGTIDPLWSLVVPFGLIQLGHGFTLSALRMLLGLRNYNRLIAVVFTLVWLLILWVGWIHPDRNASALLSQFYSTGFGIAIAWPLLPSLRSGGSIGARVLLGTAIFMVSTQLWMFAVPWLAISPETARSAVMALIALMPTLTGVAFLMMYNEATQAELKNLARIDPLTGVNNRRALLEHLDRQMKRAAGRHRPLAVLLIDVDHFKRVNDQYGHAAGDKLLLSLVNSIASAVRRTDLVGRIGGEEFAVVAPDTDLVAGVQLGERLRESVESASLRLDGRTLSATVSVGVACSTLDDRDREALLRQADQALYMAKSEGRNRVVAWYGPNFSKVPPRDPAGDSAGPSKSGLPLGC